MSCKQQAAFLPLQETAGAWTAGHQRRLGMIKSQSATFQCVSGNFRKGAVDKTDRQTMRKETNQDCCLEATARLRCEMGVLPWWDNCFHWWKMQEHCPEVTTKPTPKQEQLTDKTPSKLLESLNHEEWNLTRTKGSEKWEVPLDLIWFWSDLEWMTWWLRVKLIVSDGHDQLSTPRLLQDLKIIDSVRLQKTFGRIGECAWSDASHLWWQ